MILSRCWIVALLTALHGSIYYTFANASVEEPTAVEVQCSAELEEFVSVVAVSFDGRERKLDVCEKEILEDAFKEVYNHMTERRCDGFFRSVPSVTLNIKGKQPSHHRVRHRNLQATQQGQVGSTTTVPDDTSFFEATGNCRGCQTTGSNSFPLFDDGFRRRQLQQHEYDDDWYGYDDDGDDDDAVSLLDTCTCPADTVPAIPNTKSNVPTELIPPNAPDIDEFRRRYNKYLQNFVDKGLLQTVTKANSMEEILPESTYYDEESSYYD